MYVILNETTAIELTKDPIVLDVPHGEVSKKIAVHRYNPSLHREDLLKIANEISKVSELSELSYIILTSSASLCQDLMKIKMRVLYQPPYKNPTAYLDTAIKLLNESYVPTIGCFINPSEYSAGVLPFVYHKGELFCMLGIDKKSGQYSDYGGGFNKRFKKDKCKNSVFNLIQTSKGMIGKRISVDHFITHQSPKALLSSKVNFNSFQSDTNTKYTAFREIVEETSYFCTKKAINQYHKSDYKSDHKSNHKLDNRLDHRLKQTEYKFETMFDLDTIFNKLYDNSSYVYLGGDTNYAYDMFLVFMTVDDLPENIRYDFLNLYNLYKKNDILYAQSRLMGPNKENYIRMYGNFEIIGIDAIPLSLVVTSVENVDYEQFKNRSKYPQNIYPLIDGFRSCFADAILKYKNDFKFLLKSFDTVKNILT